MRTLIVGQHADVDVSLARRRALGQDRFDEVWDGEYRVAAPLNFGHSIVAGSLLRELGRLGDRSSRWSCRTTSRG